MSFSELITSTTSFQIFSTYQVFSKNAVISSFGMRINNVIHNIKSPDSSIKFKGINNMKIKKLMCYGKSKQKSFQFSNKLVVSYRLTENTLFELKFKNKILSIKQICEEPETYDKYITTYLTGNVNKDQLRLTIPKAFIERHKLESAVDFIQIIENNLISLIYEVPKKIADPIKTAINAHKAAIRRLEKLSVAK